MEKAGFLKKLKELNHSHKRWYAAAEAIIMNIETNSDNVLKSYTDCEIGKWFYGEGYQLSKFESFKEIEGIHIEIHRLYMEIYKAKTIFKNTKKNLNKYQNEQKEKLRKLKMISNLFIDKIKDFINELTKMDNNQFLERLNN